MARGQVDIFDPAAVSPAPSGYEWTVFDPSTATLLDPNGIVNAAPVALADGWYRYAWDASGLRNSPAQMASYHLAIPDTDFTDARRVLLKIEVRNTSNTRLVIAAPLTDDPTAYATAKGQYFGLSEGAVNTREAFSRLLNATVPIGATDSTTLPIYSVDAHVFSGGVMQSAGTISDNAVSPIAFGKLVAALAAIGLPSVGSFYTGILLGNRTTKGATETAEARLSHMVLDL